MVKNALVEEGARHYEFLKELPFLKLYPSHSNFIFCEVTSVMDAKKVIPLSGNTGFCSLSLSLSNEVLDDFLLFLVMNYKACKCYVFVESWLVLMRLHML